MKFSVRHIKSQIYRKTFSINPEEKNFQIIFLKALFEASFTESIIKKAFVFIICQKAFSSNYNKTEIH